MRTQVADTSILSFREHRSSGRLGDQQRSLMLVIHAQPRRDWSLQELSQASGIAVHVVSARVNELVKSQYLERLEATRRCSVTGKTIHPVRVRPAQMPLELAA